jgi:hypothetical protein
MISSVDWQPILQGIGMPIHDEQEDENTCSDGHVFEYWLKADDIEIAVRGLHLREKSLSPREMHGLKIQYLMNEKSEQMKPE